ncbi:MAG: hypothetical protein HKN92_11750 [Chitinophagales bacterium]|nr:hypothetical protein [Chitinophagales bacterium]
MIKYTKTTLKKFELLCEEAGYKIRYEKGQFQPGYCLLETKKVIVINKFLSTEGRISTIADLLELLDIEAEILSKRSRELYLETMNQKVNLF